MALDISLPNKGNEVTLTSFGVPAVSVMLREQQQLREALEMLQQREEEHVTELYNELKDMHTGLASIAEAIPNSELAPDWSATAARADQWGDRIAEKLKLTMQEEMKEMRELIQNAVPLRASQSGDAGAISEVPAALSQAEYVACA